MIWSRSVLLAEKLLVNYELCDRCLGRQFPRFLPQLENSERGLLIRYLSSLRGSLMRRRKVGAFFGRESRCCICNNIFDALEGEISKIVGRLSEYEFQTFLCGIKVPSQTVEMEDEMKARFKIHGAQYLKNEISSMLSREIRKRFGARKNPLNPEVTILFSPHERSFEIKSRSSHYLGRYVKLREGIPQRETWKIMEGEPGAAPESVERLIKERFLLKTGGEEARIVWFGGDDTYGLVLNDGMPFFISVINPKRSVGLQDVSDITDYLKIVYLERVKKPEGDFKTEITALLKIKGEGAITKEIVEILERRFSDSRVTLVQSGKERRKKVYSVTFRNVEEKSGEVEVRFAGGISIRGLVGERQDITVTPNFSEVARMRFSCERFDIVGVKYLPQQKIFLKSPKTVIS